MWILPDNKVVRHAQEVQINDVRYPANIFRLWTPEALAEIGIREYRQVKHDERYFFQSGASRNETTLTVTDTPITEPKYTRVQLLAKKNDEVKRTLINMYTIKRDFCESWAELEPAVATEQLAELDTYKLALRQAYVNIRAAFLALTDYQDIIDFQWQELLPVEPV